MNMDPLPALNVDEKSKMVTLTILTIFCIFLEIFLHFYLGVSIGYTHFFYILLVLAGIWYQRKAVILALCLAITHFSIGYFIFDEPLWVPLLRSAMFVIVTLLVGTLSEGLKRTEAAVKENEARFRGITERISDLIIIVDPEGYLTFVSPSVTSILGFPPESYIGKRAGPDITQAEDVVKIGQAMERLKNGSLGEQVEFRMPKSDGSYAVFEGKGIPVFTQGIYTGVQVVARDITERRQAEEALAQSEERYRTLAEASPDQIFIIGRDDTLKYANAAALKLFHLPYDQVIGKPRKDLFPPEIAKSQVASLQKVFETGETLRRDERIQFGEQEFWIDTSLVPLKDEAGNVTSVLGIARDITERKRAEEEREKIHRWQQGANRILESVLAPASVEEKLKSITGGIVRVFDADFSRIWLIDKGDSCNQGCMHAEVVEGPHVCRYRDRCLHLIVSSGRYTHIDGKAHRRVPFGAYKIGLIASGEERKFLTNDVQHDPGVHDHNWAKELELVSFAGYRLKPPVGETLGVLALFAKHPISPAEDAILEGLGSAIALVIQKDIIEQALQESERKFHTMADFTVDWEYWLAPDSSFVYISPSCEGITGYSPKEFIADPALITRIVHPDDALLVSGHFSRIHKSPEPGILDFRIVGRDGETHWLAHTCLPVYDRSGTYLGRRASNRDITDRKRAEEALKESNVRYLSFIKEAAMRLKTPVEVVERNITTVIKDINAGDIDNNQVLLQLQLQVKNMEQIRQNILNLNKTIVDGYGEISPASKQFLTE
jgi:PAS domain S-box-containing protein